MTATANPARVRWEAAAGAPGAAQDGQVGAPAASYVNPPRLLTVIPGFA